MPNCTDEDIEYYLKNYYKSNKNDYSNINIYGKETNKNEIIRDSNE